uniref:ATPase AAA-type core domain-containing protein n=1 Tax=viral metagenome TaxID=1070528 RepID=A0A6C0CM60_9ZZZZ
MSNPNTPEDPQKNTDDASDLNSKSQTISLYTTKILNPKTGNLIEINKPTYKKLISDDYVLNISAYYKDAKDRCYYKMVKRNSKEYNELVSKFQYVVSQNIITNIPIYSSIKNDIFLIDRYVNAYNNIPKHHIWFKYPVSSLKPDQLMELHQYLKSIKVDYEDIFGLELIVHWDNGNESIEEEPTLDIGKFLLGMLANPDFLKGDKPGGSIGPLGGLLGAQIKPKSAITLTEKPKTTLLNINDLEKKPHLSVVDLPEKIKHPDNFQITPKYILSQLDNDTFIKNVKVSIMKILKNKLEKYKFLSTKVDETTADAIKLIIKKIQDTLLKLTMKSIKQNFKEAILDSENGIMSLKGESREHIRNDLCSQLYSLSNGSEMYMDNFLNMAILGDSGTGKTKIASMISFVYSKLGILVNEKIKYVTRKDLVGKFVGHTAIQTYNELVDTLEGVLFIDEAYQLVKPKGASGSDFGGESMSEIVNFLDKFIGLSMVIVAGYENEMNATFFSANDGTDRRFPTKYVLKPYDAKELTLLFESFFNIKFKTTLMKLNENDVNTVYTIINNKMNKDKKYFKNHAGDIMNVVSLFSRMILTSKSLKWSKPEDRKQMILAIFEEFFKNKDEKREDKPPAHMYT